MNKSDSDDQKRSPVFFSGKIENRDDTAIGAHTFFLNKALLGLNPALIVIIIKLSAFMHFYCLLSAVPPVPIFA